MQATTTLQHEEHPAAPEVAPGNPAIGAMFLSFFGTMWLVLGCLCNSVRYELAALISAVVGLVIFTAALLAAKKLRKLRPANAEPTMAELRRDRTFNRVNMAQWLAAGVFAVVLNVIGHPEWIIASIILVVGLHFFPLARLFKRRSLVVLGFIFVFISLVLPWFVEGGPQSVALPLTAGCVLLAVAGLSVLRIWLPSRA